jgi:soluble P-type ATPase
METPKGKMKKDIKKAIKELAFGELNDKDTRNKILEELEEEYQDILVVCNDANNPTEIVDNSELVVEVFIEDSWFKYHLGKDFYKVLKT